jgi:hypothetical protein
MPHAPTVREWRQTVRPSLLLDLVDRTRDLRWSQALLTLVLDELYVADDFERLVPARRRRGPSAFPRLLALAVLLRHSWSPRDLMRTAARLGLSCPPAQPAAHPTHTTTNAPATAAAAVAASGTRRPRGRASCS